MSVYLWKYYLQDDFDNFQRVLATAKYSGSAQPRAHGTGGNTGSLKGSPRQGYGTSPSFRSRSIAQTEWGASIKATETIHLSRADVNSRDSHGVGLLHLISASSAPNASSYALSLLEIPLLDLYLQDMESGWTALHRALYFGNVTIARALMDRDTRDAMGREGFVGPHGARGLIKIKDHEGNSPFDVFSLTIANRSLRHSSESVMIDAGSNDDEDESERSYGEDEDAGLQESINGDELYTFGSNKNFTLGFGDEDDRQFPERVMLKRPAHLISRLFVEYQNQCVFPGVENQSSPKAEPNIHFPQSVPAPLQYQAIKILDVKLSKLHTAVLTTDPEANLHICGFGPGGRLGTGDEITRFNFTCIYGGGLAGKKVTSIGLGQNHTVAVCRHGEAFSWGNNAFGQLGYALPNPSGKDETPVQLLPRQIFGPLKREAVIGVAASSTHSVVFTATALYTFGKNDGQLGLVDADARSLETQTTPRRVAAALFSSSICMVTAIEKATVCLLENHDVWVFANYGWKKISFPLDSLASSALKSSYMSTRYDTSPNHISKISSGGDTICALARSGDVFTVTVSHSIDAYPNTGSTTNPNKIRGALSAPQRIWSLRKGHMAVKDVDVGHDGSVIICTVSGSVWKRVKRAKVKDANAALGALEYRPKDYKFSRIPGLTRITAVRSNTFGAFAAVRKDVDVLKSQVDIASSTLWVDFFPLLSFHKLSNEEDSETEEPMLRYWIPRRASDDPATIRHAVFTLKDIEKHIEGLLAHESNNVRSSYDIKIGTTVSNVRLPCHEFMLAGRSSLLRRTLPTFRETYYYSLHDVFTIEYDKQGGILILFQGLDFLTILNLLLYIYTDSVVDVWHQTKQAPQMAFRYRQIRTELMKTAAQLDLRGLERAVRTMVAPPRDLHRDMELAVLEPAYFETGDAEVELNGATAKVHSALVCQRCPFFDALFYGRAGGGWLSSRRENMEEPYKGVRVDMKHVDLEVFQLVRRHIYADTGEELFENVYSEDLEAFLDLVMDVLSVANELMLDRLAQICQKVLGRFVNTRNVCQLLNAVAPCSVTQFKDAALEYICLNLEGMLENYLLGELDDHLMVELDDVVRQNQLSCLPISKSGRAEAELLEHHPELAGLIDQDKSKKIDSMAIQSRLHRDEARFETAARIKSSTTGDSRRIPASPVPRPSSSGKTVHSASPELKARASAQDLMFDMDDGDELNSRRKVGKGKAVDRFGDGSSTLSAAHPPQTPPKSFREGSLSLDLFDQKLSPPVLNPDSTSSVSPSGLANSSRNYRSEEPVPLDNSHVDSSALRSAPWKTTPFDSPKIGLKNIMAQHSSSKPSELTTALNQQAGKTDKAQTAAKIKLSQKERKKQLQQQQLQHNGKEPPLEFKPAGSNKKIEDSAAPWRTVSTGPRINLKDVLHGEKDDNLEAPKSQNRTVSNPSLTLRQTVPGNASSARRATSEQQMSPQRINLSSSPIVNSRPPITPQKSLPITASPSNSPIPARSIRHTPKPVEPSLQLSMADILSQQQTEKDIIKEAVAKRSLQEIQEEQAFQEWWDQEEAATKARLLEVESRAQLPSSSRGRGGKSSRGGRGKGRDRMERGGGGGRGGHHGAGTVRPGDSRK